jgi:hypothetical protein
MKKREAGSMERSIKEIWQDIHKKDVKDEERVKKWLEKKGFRIDYVINKNAQINP